MKLIPFDEFTLESNLRPEQVKVVLDESFVTYSFDFASSQQGNFGGFTSGEDTFAAELIGIRNTSCLTINGAVTATDKGCTVKAKAKLAPMHLAIKTIVLLFLGSWAIVFSSHTVFVDPLTKQAIVLYLLTIGLLALWIWDFNSSVGYAKDKLATLINAKPVA